MSKSHKKAIAPNAKKPAVKVAKGAKLAKLEVAPKTADITKADRSSSKQNALIWLLQRPGGATIEEMAKATGWQNHSVLGAISGVLRKRLGLIVASEKEERGRVYRIAGRS
jgi:hypothetical protein